jgi:single-stranded DNA-binding protein
MIIGNLGRDPEMRYTPSGQAVTQFTVAVNRNYKDSQGERQEETEWFRVVAWGQQAEFVANTIQNLERRPRDDAGDGGSQLPPEPRERQRPPADQQPSGQGQPEPETYDDLPF